MPSTILSDNGVTSGTSGLKSTGSNDGQLALQTTTAGGTATTALTINTSQNVGIGTTSPLEKLHVAGPVITTSNLSALRASTMAVDFYLGEGRLISTGADASTHAPLTFGTATTTTYAERGRFEANGNLKLALNLSVGSATPTTSGTGITFPATQSASTNANTLDDYEEGDFTPTARGASTAGTTTYSTQVGRYVKVGKQVTVSLDLGVTGMTGTGNLEIASLPFTVGGSETVAIGAMMTNNLDWPSGTCPVAYANPGNNYLNIWVSADNAGWAIQTVDTDFRVITTITYFV